MGGESWIELVDKRALPQCGGKNYNIQLGNHVVCNSNAQLSLPSPICSRVWERYHYSLAQKGESCNDACASVKRTDGKQYVCEQGKAYDLDSNYKLSLALSRVGVLCNEYSTRFYSANGGGRIMPSVEESGGKVTCHRRAIQDGR